MDHGDLRDTITDLLRRVRALEVENRGLKLTLYGAVVRGGQGIEVAEGSYIGAGPDVRLGTLTAGGWGVQIPYKGKPSSVESLIWDREVQASAAQTTADQAHDRMDPGGDMNNWATAISNVANAANSSASSAHARMNPGGDVNNWISAVSGVANNAWHRAGAADSKAQSALDGLSSKPDRASVAQAIRDQYQNSVNLRSSLAELAAKTGKQISLPNIIAPHL